MHKFPKISYCIATYNEEKNIESCLESIFDQDYPKECLEVIIVDDGSTDRTLKIAKKFPVKIVRSGEKDPAISFLIGFTHATGIFVAAEGADMRFRGKDWFKKLVRPMLDNPEIAASFTCFYSHPKESLINKYLTLDPFQRDLIYQFFSPNIDETIISKNDGYYICRYTRDRMPPTVHGLYRKSILHKLLAGKKIWHDLGILALMVNNGYNTFSYVPDAGFYHFHVSSLKDLLRKRKRNIKRSYLKYNSESQYKWFDLTSVKDILKIITLLLCANLFIPIFLFSLYRIIKHKKPLYILDAPITLILIDSFIYYFLTDSRGRRMLLNNFSIILKNYK